MSEKFKKKKVTMHGQTFDSYSEAAETLGKSLSAISRYVKKHGSLDLPESPTKELLTSGRLGKVYHTTKEAKKDLFITTDWAVFMKRFNNGIPLEAAKDDALFKIYKRQLKERDKHTFKEPIVIKNKSYKTYYELQEAFGKKLNGIASPQTIQRRRKRGVTGLDLLKIKHYKTPKVGRL